MYTLAFDTTGSYCSVILLQDSKTIAVYSRAAEFGQAELLMVKIREMLAESGLSLARLELVAVCTGPGSFTGVRSSIAAARAFSLACPDLTVCGISAFEAYAHSVDEDERAEINAVLIETKRDDFYAAFFDRNLQKIKDYAVAERDDIIHFLQGHKVTLAGDGVERFLNRPSGLSLHSVHLDEHVSIESLAHVAVMRYKTKHVDFPKPLYLKAPDVCVK